MSTTADTIASEVISASLGGAFSSAVLYPLEVLKTKMQADDKETNVIMIGRMTTMTMTKSQTNQTTSSNMIQYGIDLYQQKADTKFS